MPSLHDVERRINSVRANRKITSTMQMIASTKVGKSYARFESSKAYTKAISSMTDSLNNGDNSSDLLNLHEDIKTTLLIVIVSDKGLAGGFNMNVLHLAQKYLNDNKREGKKTKIIACGKKAQQYFGFREIKTEMDFVGTSENPQYSQAEKIGDYCVDNYLSGDIDEVVVLYNKCKNNIQQTLEDTIILPVQKGEDSEVTREEVVYEPNKNVVLDGLIPLYVKTVIYNSLLDSAAGEQVARRIAMQNATDNADEMLENLTRIYNSVRQGSITTEINEIVGGADAAQQDE